VEVINCGLKNSVNRQYHKRKKSNALIKTVITLSNHGPRTPFSFPDYLTTETHI